MGKLRLNKPVVSRQYSAKILSKGKDKVFPAFSGILLEGDVQIATFSRGAVRNHFVPPIEYKFHSTQAHNRFANFADCLSIAESIEAVCAGQIE